MSVRVISKVWSYSQATLGARLVMLALADSAHDDGVTWISQEALGVKARLSERQVRRVLDDLIESGEIEMRKAQRGRSRINVYRIQFEGIEQPNYDRLPFEIEPFSRADISAGRESTSGHFVPPRADISDAPSRARDYGGKGLNRKGPVSDSFANAQESRRAGKSSPPIAALIDGRNLPFDALQAVDPGSSDKQIAAALKIIREEFWREALEEQGRRGPDVLDVSTDFETFGRALAAAILHRAEIYRDRWPYVELTATALAKHWRRMALAAPQRKPTAREILDAVLAEDDE